MILETKKKNLPSRFSSLGFLDQSPYWIVASPDQELLLFHYDLGIFDLSSLYTGSRASTRPAPERGLHLPPVPNLFCPPLCKGQSPEDDAESQLDKMETRAHTDDEGHSFHSSSSATGIRMP